MKLIDADEVLDFPNLSTSGYEDTLQDLIAEYIPEDVQIEYEEELTELCKAVVNAVMNVVETSPIIDAELVIHAHWAKKRDRNDNLYCYCSSCGLPVSYFWERSNYCPNCGAKMGDKNEN